MYCVLLTVFYLFCSILSLSLPSMPTLPPLVGRERRIPSQGVSLCVSFPFWPPLTTAGSYLNHLLLASPQHCRPTSDGIEKAWSSSLVLAQHPKLGKFAVPFFRQLSQSEIQISDICKTFHRDAVIITS